jgi:signal transduction histidine kinase
MASIVSSIRRKWDDLRQDDIILPRVYKPRRIIAEIIGILAIILMMADQFKVSLTFTSIFYLIIFIGGTICSHILRYLQIKRHMIIIQSLAMVTVVILMAAQSYQAYTLAFFILSYTLQLTFYRFPLYLALMLGIIPSLLYGIYIYLIAQVTLPYNTLSFFAILSFFLIFGFNIIYGASRRRHEIVNQHLTWTRDQLEQEIVRNAQLAVVRERARIARDMHDILAHSLTVLSVQTQAARQTLMNNPTKTASLLDEMTATLRQSINESHQLVQVLREATELDDGDTSLAVQLQRITDRFGERTGLRTTISEYGQPQSLTDEIMTSLRFVVQEAITNAYRHGAAQQMAIVLQWNEKDLSICMDDNGTPQPIPLMSKGGNGLQGIRERMEILGGTFTAGARPDGVGFSIHISIPYQVHQEARVS